MNQSPDSTPRRDRTGKKKNHGMPREDAWKKKNVREPILRALVENRKNEQEGNGMLDQRGPKV